MRVILDVDTSDLPAHTAEEFREWVAFSVGASGSMANANPLADCDLRCHDLTVRP